jgi:hypothetical protein
MTDPEALLANSRVAGPSNLPGESRTMIEAFLLRELESVRRELAMYPDEALIWLLPPGTPNSAGTLALHLAGNLQHYFGAVMGRDGYVRDRPAEFATRDLPRSDLLVQLESAERAVVLGLERLEDEQIDQPFPVPLRELTLTTGQVLIQLAIHLAYHLGQISYHRRLVTHDPAGVDAVNPDMLGALRNRE